MAPRPPDQSGPLPDLWMALLFQVGTSMAVAAVLGWIPGLRPGWAVVNLLVLLLFSRLLTALEGVGMASLGLAFNGRWVREFAAGLGIGTGVILGSALLLALAGGVRFRLGPGAGVWPLLSGALFYLLPAVNEELAYRGYSFQRVTRRLGGPAALAILSVLFALAHRANPNLSGSVASLSLVNIGLAGVLLGLAQLRTGSLALPMGIHLAWNWTQGPLLGFGVSGLAERGLLAPALSRGPLWLTGGAFGLEGSILCTAMAASACVLVARLWPKASKI